jgi:hypothetical protein
MKAHVYLRKDAATSQATLYTSAVLLELAVVLDFVAAELWQIQSFI